MNVQILHVTNCQTALLSSGQVENYSYSSHLTRLWSPTGHVTVQPVLERVRPSFRMWPSVVIVASVPCFFFCRVQFSFSGKRASKLNRTTGTLIEIVFYFCFWSTFHRTPELVEKRKAGTEWVKLFFFLFCCLSCQLCALLLSCSWLNDCRINECQRVIKISVFSIRLE